MAEIRVLVCCGTGIATSVQVANKLKKLMKDRGIKIETAECKAIELPSRAQSFRPHAIVATTQINPKLVPVKVFSGIPFLTGVGIDAAADEVFAALRPKK